MKRIVVTGSKGGTGRSIVAELRGAGFDVVGIDVLPPQPTDVGYVRLDLTNGLGLNDVFADADAIVHFGSYATDAWSSTTDAFHNLMLGGFNVLQAAANTGVKRVIIASSIMAYGDLTRQPAWPVTEESPVSPHNIYSSSKRLLELLAADYCRWHGLSIAALRIGRIVYEGCYGWRLKHHTASEASAANVLWTYVDARDVATACRLWLESDRQGFEIYNVAAENICHETPIAELLKKFYPTVNEMRADLESHQTPFDTSKLRKTLDWASKYDWKEMRAEYEQSVAGK